MVEAYLKVLELAFYEATFAFDGLSDDNVWKRPAEGLLSVGELAGHIAFWLAVKLASADGKAADRDLSKCHVASPLIDQRFRYLPTTLETPPTPEHLALTAEQVSNELQRVYTESVAHFRLLDPELSETPPGYPPNFTYEWLLQYCGFHVCYHVGQMYTARHLLGEETPDN